MRRWIALFLCVYLLVPGPLWAAITFDVASSSGGTTSTSHSHTVAADANIAIICVFQRETGLNVQQAASVTVGGQNADFLVGVNTTNNNLRADFFYKLTPLTGAQTVAVTGGAGTDRMVTGVMTFKGVAQTSTFNTPGSNGAAGNGTNVDIDGLASAVGEVGVMCGGTRVQTVTPSADATVPVSTERFEQPFDSAGSSTLGFGYTEDGAASTIDMRVDLSGSDLYAAVAVSMREAVAAATGRNRPAVLLP